MRLAISNLAWDPPEDEAVAALLARVGVDAIEVAPTKYFPQPAAAADADVARVRRWWRDRGIEPIAMQSLLFGTQGLNVFGPRPVQDAMLAHLDAVCRIGAGLGARRLVFGSPRNRDRASLDDATALAIAVDVFGRLGEVAASHGVQVCLEPNPARYGANFMVSTDEAARVVRAVGHPAIRLQLDGGALAVDGADPDAVLREHGALVGHAHASEPGLAPLGADGGEGGTGAAGGVGAAGGAGASTDAEGADRAREAIATPHAAIAHALHRHSPGLAVSIEMLAPAGAARLPAIERALAFADRHYRADAGRARTTETSR